MQDIEIKDYGAFHTIRRNDELRLIFESELLVVLVTLSGAISEKDCAEIEQYLNKGYTIKGVGDGPAGLKIMLEKIR